MKFPTIFELHAKIKSALISPSNIFSESSENISRINGKIGSFTILSEFDNPALTSNVDNPLFGIPFSVKDIIDTKGVVTEYGSEIFRRNVPDRDAEIVKRLKDHGSVMQGKTNTHEFAMGIITPQCSNPWDLQRVTGGSSGGSAASVASGLSFYSIGTDTAGSIRIPASMCGITGMKPTTGVLPLEGILPEAWSLDTVGPLTRYASDIPPILSAMGLKDITHTNARKIPIAAVITNLMEKSDSNVSRTLWKFLDKAISEDILEIEEVDIPELSEMAIRDDIIDGCENATFHRERFSKMPMLFSKMSAKQIQYYSSIPASDYIEAMRYRKTAGRELRNLFGKYDILVSPTVPTTAPLKVDMMNMDFKFFMKYMEFTNPFNYTGLPAMSIPAGLVDNLPIGLQIIGNLNDDYFLCRIATELQSVTDYHKKMPPLSEEVKYSFLE